MIREGWEERDGKGEGGSGRWREGRRWEGGLDVDICSGVPEFLVTPLSISSIILTLVELLLYKQTKMRNLVSPSVLDHPIVYSYFSQVYSIIRLFDRVLEQLKARFAQPYLPNTFYDSQNTTAYYVRRCI